MLLSISVCLGCGLLQAVVRTYLMVEVVLFSLS